MQIIPGHLAALRRRRQQRRSRQSDNTDDAALTAAGYLCWRGKDLSTASGWVDALHAYNHSDQYARLVRDWATAYANGHPAVTGRASVQRRLRGSSSANRGGR